MRSPGRIVQRSTIQRHLIIFMACILPFTAFAKAGSSYEKSLSRHMSCHVDRKLGRNPARLFINNRECIRPLIFAEGPLRLLPKGTDVSDYSISGCLQYKGESIDALQSRLHINSYDAVDFLNNIRGFESNASVRCTGKEFSYPHSRKLINYAVESLQDPYGDGSLFAVLIPTGKPVKDSDQVFVPFPNASRIAQELGKKVVSKFPIREIDITDDTISGVHPNADSLR